MRKKDLEILKQLKMQEQKDEKKVDKKPMVVKPIENTVSFDAWWADAAKKANLVPHLKEIVWADFRSRGLKKEEPAVRYTQALAVFGYKI